MGDNFQRIIIDRTGFSARCYNTDHKACSGITKRHGKLDTCTCGCHQND